MNKRKFSAQAQLRLGLLAFGVIAFAVAVNATTFRVDAVNDAVTIVNGWLGSSDPSVGDTGDGTGDFSDSPLAPGRKPSCNTCHAGQTIKKNERIPKHNRALMERYSVKFKRRLIVAKGSSAIEKEANRLALYRLTNRTKKAGSGKWRRIQTFPPKTMLLKDRGGRYVFVVPAPPKR